MDNTQTYCQQQEEVFQKLVDLELKRISAGITGAHGSSIDSLRETVEQSLRWRALEAGRVNLMGHSGFRDDGLNPYGNPYDGYAHLTMNAWTIPASELDHLREEMAREHSGATALLQSYAAISANRNLTDKIIEASKADISRTVERIRTYGYTDTVTMDQGVAVYKKTVMSFRIVLLGEALDISIQHCVPDGVDLPEDGVYRCLEGDSIRGLIRAAVAHAELVCSSGSVHPKTFLFKLLNNFFSMPTTIARRELGKEDTMPLIAYRVGVTPAPCS